MTIFSAPRGLPRFTPVALAIALGLGLCTVATAQDLVLGPGVEAHPGIDAIYAKFTQGYKDLDAPRVAALYTQDALYLPPGDDVLRGRDAIEQRFAAAFSRAWEAGERWHIRFEILDRGVEGSLAYDVGYYHLDRVPRSDDNPGEGGSSTGKFTVVIRCQGKQGPCHFQVDGYSGVPRAEPAPLPAAPAAPDPVDAVDPAYAAPPDPSAPPVLAAPPEPPPS